MPEFKSDPYQHARDHIDLAVLSLQIPPDRAETLRIRHEAAMRVDPSTGALSYTDGSSDTGAWLRGVGKREPALMGRAPASKVTPTAEPSTMTATMDAVRSGRMTAEQAVARHLDVRARAAAAPAAPTNWTAVMRAGGDAAIRYLNHRAGGR